MDEELSGNGAESDFNRFSAGNELLVLRGEHGVSVGRGEGCHVESLPWFRAAGLDGSPASCGAAVAVHGSKAGECRGLPSIETSELWKGDQQGGGDGRSDSRGLPQGFALTAQCGVVVDVRIELGLVAPNAGSESADLTVDLGADSGIVVELQGGAQTCPCLDEGVEPLVQLAELLLLFPRRLKGWRVEGRGIAGDDGGVDAIGLGQAAGCACESPDVSGVDQRNGNASSEAGEDELASVAAGGLAGDPDRALQGDQEVEEAADAGTGIRPVVTGSVDGGVEGQLAEVDADLECV